MTPLVTETTPVESERRTTSAATETESANVSLSDVLMTLRKRKWVLIVAVLLGILFGIYQAITQPRLYEAYGRIEIRSGSSNQYKLEATQIDNSSTVRLSSEALILKSDSLLLAVAQDLDLANNPEFLGTKPLTHVDVNEPGPRQAVLSAMQGAITVSGITKTDIILISCKTYSAALSAEVVNKLIDEYISRSFNSRVNSTSHVAELLTKQLDQLKHDVETSQQKMIDTGKRLGILILDPTHNQITSSLDDLTRATGEAEVARIVAESRYRVLSNMDPNSLDQSIAAVGGAAATSQLSLLRGQLETARAQYAALGANAGPNLPAVKAIRAQMQELAKAVDDEQKRVLVQARETYVAAKANEDQTRGALEAQRSEAYKLRDDLVQYNIYQREFESNRTLYESLLERLRSAGVQAGLESTEIDVIDPALPPAKPSLRRKSAVLLIDTLVALIIGVILAFILEALDTGLRSVAEIEQVSGLPSLALIPRTRRTGVDLSQLTIAERNIATLSSPKSQFAEAFRSLRTSLLLSTAGKLPKTILLTSGTPSEGKTTVSVNLACVLAQRDVRVLLIDADLRRPTVHHRFGLNGKVGLTSVLTGTVPIEEAVQRVPELPTLDILVSGPIPPFPTEMLSSAVMVQLLEKCRGLYTHIVIDSPPLLSVTDGVVLARDADAVVLVVRHGRSNRPALRRSCDLLSRSGAPMTGIALNAVDLNSPEYYGYYGYYGYNGYSGYASAGVDSTGWEPGSEAQRNGKPSKSKSSASSKGDQG